MDRKSLVLALIGASFAGAFASADPSFYSGAELAERLLHNVVLIRTKENLKGAGFVVGADRDWLYIATALHTLQKPKAGEDSPGEFSASIRLRMCAADSFDALNLDPSAIYFVDEVRDIAAFRIPPPADFKPVLTALAPAPPAAGAAIWSIGKDGECKIGTANSAVDTAEDKEGNLVIDIAGAYGGTSGSPVMTDRGIVGLVWSSADDVKVTARSIAVVHERIASSSASAWTLGEANNLPPATKEAVRWELTKILNDYMFTVKDMRDAFVKKSYHFILLGPIVDRYNASIKAFNEAKDRHDGTLEREWGTQTREEYSTIRSRVDSIHARIRAFNRHMEELRLGTRIPQPIREEMQNISPEIEALDKSVAVFLGSLKAEDVK